MEQIPQGNKQFRQLKISNTIEYSELANKDGN